MQIPALHDCYDLGNMGIGFQAQLVLPLVDLLRVVPIDHVGGVPVGILLREAAYGRIIVAGAEVVGSGFKVQVLAAVAEGVAVQGIRVLFVAEGVVVVGVADCAVGVGGRNYMGADFILAQKRCLECPCRFAQRTKYYGKF